MKRIHRKIEIDYLPRVEGETNIEIELGHAPAIRLKIFEPPRFFEGFLVGRRFDEVGDIVSRICGICPVSHMTTAIQAIEKAMGIEVSPQTVTLRKLMSISQIMASHLVHLYMLAMPDYYGCDGFPAMRRDVTRQTEDLLILKDVFNALTGLIGGRALHPVTHLPGGFTAVPSNEAVGQIATQLKQIRPNARRTAEEVAHLGMPDFHCDSEYVCLDTADEYAINGGRIVSTRGLNIAVEDYHAAFHESETEYAFAKKTTRQGASSIMSGAMARLNIKFAKLRQTTKDLAEALDFRPPSDNPFHNNIAQALEIVDGVEHCIELIESSRFEDEDIHIRINAGTAGAVTEAPRGLLYHWYEVDGKGIVQKANIVTPTSHNFSNIEKHLLKLVQENNDKSPPQIRLLCEELVRAYDPCFSCSVH
ncbi:MAG: nickel-dependent hydrogenase large subunit [Planctomycetaceae bacterium]|nr:nickel-dependent hydrogenase large subunit [Planctomycetaceae bacterium]